MSKYEKYKPSGIEGIGDVPEHWKVTHLKRDLKFYNNIRIPLSSEERADLDNIYDYYGASGVIDKVDRYLFDGDYILIGEDGANLLDRNSPLAFKATGKFWVNNHAHIIKPINGNIDFFVYFLESIDFTVFITGSAQPKLTIESLSGVRMIIPPVSEQLTIANYLDNQTQKIDRLISNKKAQADKLKELRQIEIDNAVTKGLNPNIELKDSGIDWLGKIPKHWEVKRLKKFTTKVGSGVTPKGGSEVYEETGIPLFRSQNIHFDGLRTDDIVYITDEVHQSMSGSKVEPNDVLLNITGASIGRCYFYDGSMGEANVNQHVCIIRTNSKLDYRYLQQFMSSDCAQSQIFMGQTGTSREGLTFQDIKNMFIPTPPSHEQIEITDFVKIRTNKIDKLIKNIETQIEKLQELRKIKIYEAVTGKIKVTA